MFKAIQTVVLHFYAHKNVKTQHFSAPKSVISPKLQPIKFAKQYDAITEK
jgi:hypothetical protein